MKSNNQATVVLVSVLLSIPLGQLFIDIYVPAFTSIKSSFHTSADLVQLSLTAYFVTLGFFQMVYGSLSDIIGRKKPLIIGLSLGLVGSAVARFSPDIQLFLIGRIIQGIGMGGVSGIGGAILVDYFSKDPDDLARKNTYVSITYNLTPVIAPYIGGLLLYLFYWQAIFEFLFAYNFIILLWVIFLYQETNKHLSAFSFLGYIKQFVNYRVFLTNSSFWYISIILGAIWSMTLAFMSLGPFVYFDLYHFSGYDFGILALVMGLASLTGSVLNRLFLLLCSGNLLLKLLMFVNLCLGIILIPVSILASGSFIYLTIVLFLMFMTYGVMFPNAYTILMLLFKNNAGSSISLSVSMTVLFSMLITAVCAMLPETIFMLAAMELFLSILTAILITLTLRRVAKN